MSRGLAKKIYTCTNCKITFQVKAGELKKTKRPFCTKECWDKFQKGENNPAYKGSGIYKNCLNCEMRFFVKTKKRHNKAKYCTRKCMIEYHKKHKHPLYQDIWDKCNFCQNKIKITERKIGKRNFCNKECAEKGHSEYIKGVNNGRYVHGEGNSSYPKNWNKRLKEAIRERDGHKCKNCGLSETEHGSKLHVHHIDSNKENLSEINLITLCKFCHGKTHGLPESRTEWKEKLLNLLK
jgi:hypothetical protein